VKPVLLVVLVLGLVLAPASAARAGANEPLPLLELVQGDGVGRLYTLSYAEYRTADTTHGMTPQPVRNGYMRPKAFAGGHAVYRLTEVASGARLVTASQSERDSLAASGRFRYEGVVGYAYDAPHPGTARLLRYSKAGEWRVALEPPHGPALSGYRLDGSLGYVDVRWIRAGALYFGSFNGGTRNIIDATKRVYGRDGDWWGGVRDFSGADPAVPVNRWVWPNEDFSYLQPAIGFYDDSQPATVEKHITQASSAGLSYFAFYWYWSGLQGQETLGAGLRSFLAARNRGAMDFALTVCSHDYGTGSLSIPTAQYGQVAAALVDYMRQPNYLRANDGRRILWLCDTRGIGSGSAADVQAFVNTVRGRARAILGSDILVLAHRDLGLDLAAVGADGAYCGARYNATEDGSFARYVAGQREYFASGPPVFVRCAMSDFDERPRYPMFYAQPGDARNMADRTPALFGQAVRDIRDDIGASTRTPLVDNFALFYSWNEWHEGGIPLEPNARDGCANLDIVRAGLGLTSGAGCIARPADDAPPPATPGATPPARLRVRVAVPRRQRLRRRALTARVRCSLRCRVAATAKLRVARKPYRARPRTLKAGRWTALRLRAPKRTHARVRRAVRGDRRGALRVKLVVRAAPRPSGRAVRVTRARRIAWR